MEGDMIMMQDLFEFIRTDTDSEGKVVGAFRTTGVRSAYTQRIEAYGYKLEGKIFKTGESA